MKFPGIYILVYFVIFLTACGGSGDSSPPTAEELIDDRPFEIKIPSSYDATTATALIVVLHGFTGDGEQILSYFRMSDAAERHGFLVAYPDGSRDSLGRRHWNATDACCAFDANRTNDVRYLTALIDDVEANYTIDPKRVYIIGYSNGGYMSHRMACDHSNRVAAIVSLAGASWKDPDICQTLEPVSILQVHGDLDNSVLYSGGINGSIPYPSAVDTVSDWASRNGCTGILVDSGMNVDIDVGISGNETRVQQFGNCPTSGDVELWTILGGNHGPNFDNKWPDFIWAFLSNHPKP